MTTSQRKRSGPATEGLEDDVARLEKLPTEVLQEIINDLAFDNVIALIKTKNRHIIESIQDSISYKTAFSGISAEQDLVAVAEIISLCYEVSSYRHSSRTLCGTFADAARRGQRRAINDNSWGPHHLHTCWHEVDLPSCTADYQVPYHKGSVRGARWNRVALYKGTPLPGQAKQPEVSPYSVSADGPRAFSPDRWYDTDLWPNFYRRILYRLKTRLNVNQDLRYAISPSNRTLLNGIYKLLAKPKIKDLLVVREPISEGVHKFVAGLQFPQVSAVEKIMRPFQEFLGTQKNIELLTMKEQYRRPFANSRLTVKVSGIKDIFLQEIADHLIRPLISTFAIEKIEEHVYQQLQAAPAASYDFFSNYFLRGTNHARSNQLSPFRKFLFGDADHRLADDGQFWWDTLRFIYQARVYKDLLQLAEIYEKHPHMLLKYQDPGETPRRNVAHITNRIKGHAQKRSRYDPFSKPISPRCSSLLRGPGLPFVPLDSLLNLFLETLARYPLKLTDLDATERLAWLALESDFRARYQTPKILQETHDSPSTATTSNTFSAELLLCLSGLANIYIKEQGPGPKRIVGNFQNGNLRFSRRACSAWDDHRAGFRPFGPYHQMELEWLQSFLQLCESFSQESPSRHLGWTEIAANANSLVPGPPPQEVIDARYARKVRKWQRQADGRDRAYENRHKLPPFCFRPGENLPALNGEAKHEYMHQ